MVKKIHNRDLNSRRSKEIISASRQAREFFRNASSSNYSVRPLLTFYGVASLARALSLLLKRDGGEESLTGGHGLEPMEWRSQLSGDLSRGLGALGDIRIRTCSGLFADLVRTTQNRTSIHVNSAGVDWRLSYDIPESGDEITLQDLMSRVPDLRKDFELISDVVKFASVQSMTYNQDAGFNAKVSTEYFTLFKDTYSSMGYKIDYGEKHSTISAESLVFSHNLPQFIHTYVDKFFGYIPGLFIVEPFPSGNRYSQLCVTYMFSYILGMLARYYPTHWISLIHGEKGDALWPTINRAQRFAEQSFPELVIELISDVLKHPLKSE